jgi:hypothetical protein
VWVKISKTEAIVLGLIVVVGFALRFFRLETWSFWPDELFSIGTRPDGFTENPLWRSLATDLIRYTAIALGPSEWSARLVPALIGAVSIPLLYPLLRRSFQRAGAQHAGVQRAELWAAGALFATALLALSPWHIYWSQNARFYTLLFLFFNFGLLLFYLGLEEDRPWYLVAALLFIGLAARERLVALLGAPALLLYVILLVVLRYARPKGFNRRNLLIFFGPAALIGLLMLLPLLPYLGAWQKGFARINSSAGFLAAGTIYYIGLPIAVLAAGSGLYLTGFGRYGSKQRLPLLLGLVAVVPLAILMALAQVQYAANRYGFFALYSWLALAGLGFQAIWQRVASNGAREGLRWAVLVACTLLALYATDLFQYYTVQKGNRDDWRSAFAYIAEHGRPGDRVIASDYDIFAHYLGEPFVYRTWKEAPEEIIKMADVPGRRIWYVEDMTVAEMHAAALAEMQSHAAPQADFDVRLPGRTYRMRVYFTENP